jgi:uncharacterized membrane protein (DUF4010 family)
MGAPEDVASSLWQVSHWPFVPVLTRLGLAVAIGLFKFGLIFLALNVVGGLAQRNFGPASFYFVSIAGGLLSSASSIASAATLITHHEISGTTGVNGIILSSLTSILINVPLIRSMTKETAFKRRVCLGLALVAIVGLLGVGLNEMISVFAPRFLTGS